MGQSNLGQERLIFQLFAGFTKLLSLFYEAAVDIHRFHIILNVFFYEIFTGIKILLLYHQRHLLVMRVCKPLGVGVARKCLKVRQMLL